MIRMFQVYIGDSMPIRLHAKQNCGYNHYKKLRIRNMYSIYKQVAIDLSLETKQHINKYCNSPNKLNKNRQVHQINIKNLEYIPNLWL